MKITGIDLKNFLIFKELKLGGDGNPQIGPHMNVMLGLNSQGKTDILKAIPAGLLGELDPTMIHNGADKAEIVIDLEQYRIKRTITSKNTKTLKIVSQDGSVNNNLQAYIDSLIGIENKEKRSFLFNPISFVLADNKTKYLRELFKTTIKPEHLESIPDEFKDGLDYSQDGLDIINLLANDKNGLIYRKRADLSKVVAQKKALFDAKAEEIAGYDPATYNPKKVDSVSTEITKLKQDISNAETLKAQEENSKTLRDDLNEKIDEAEKELEQISIDELLVQDGAALRAEIDAINKQIEELQKQVDDKTLALEAIRDNRLRRQNLVESLNNWKTTLNAVEIKNIPDIEALKVKLTEQETLRDSALIEEQFYEAYLDNEELKLEYGARKDEVDKLSDNLNYLRKDLTAILTKEARIPIDGLEIKGNTIFVNDISIDNMSTKEQMTFALGITLRLNAESKFQVLLCDRIESLDSDSFDALRDWVVENDVQLFATQVLHRGEIPPEGALFVENGAIKELA